MSACNICCDYVSTNFQDDVIDFVICNFERSKYVENKALFLLQIQRFIHHALRARIW